MTVFKEVYEVVGAEALEKARAFEAAREAAHEAQWAIAKAFGGIGYRPARYGGIKSILFKQGAAIPKGFRRVGSGDDGKTIECVSSRNTGVGKEVALKMAHAPRIEEWGKFADAFGWKGRSPMGMSMGRGCIYFASGVRVSFPKERFFLKLPRELDDGWSPPDGLAIARESDMLRALEDHNAEAKRREKKPKKKAA